MKKILSLILVLSLVLTLVSGCGKKQEAGNDSNEPVKLVALVATDSTQGVPEITEATLKKIREDINVDLEIIYGSADGNDYTQKMNTMLSGGEQLDIMESGWEPLQAKNMCAELTDALKSDGQDLYNFIGEDNFTSTQTSDKRIWAIPRMVRLCTTYPIYVRQDWLDKLGLKAPTTIDELEQVATAFRDNDPAGGGKTVPLATTTRYSRYALAGAFIKDGWGEYKDASDGKIKPPYMNEGYKDFVTKMADWYKKGLIGKECFSWSNQELIDAVESSRVGSTATWYSRVTLRMPNLVKVDPNAKYTLCSVTGPQGIAETVNASNSLPSSSSGASSSGTDSYVISSKCKNVKAAIKLMNWFYKDHNALVCMYGEEGKDFEIIKEDKEAKFIQYKVLREDGARDATTYNLALGFIEQHILADNATVHDTYIAGLPSMFLNVERAKKTFDCDTFYDADALNTAVPTYVDIETIVDEYFVKFVTGELSLDKFDEFYKALDDAGINTLIDEITRQYNEQHK